MIARRAGPELPGLSPSRLPGRVSRRNGRVLLVPDRQLNPRIELDVLEFAAVSFGVDHEALAVVVDPDRMGLKVTGG